MNTFLNQLKWDFHRIFFYWISWIVLLTLTATFRFALLIDDDWFFSLEFLWSSWTSLTLTSLGALLTARLLFFTPFADENSYWRTLPISTPTLFWEKATLLFLLILLPLCLFFTLPIAFFIPRLSFVSEFSTSSLLMHSYLLLWTIVLCVLSSRPMILFGWILGVIFLHGFLLYSVPLIISPENNERDISSVLRNIKIITSLNLSFAVSSFLLTTSLILSVYWRKRLPTIALATIALLAFSTSGSLWNYHYFESSQSEPLIRERLDLRVLDQGEALSKEEVLISPQLAGTVPDGKILIPTRYEIKTYHENNNPNHDYNYSSDTTNELRLAPQLAKLLPGNPQTNHLLADDFMRLTLKKSPELSYIEGSYLADLLEPKILPSVLLSEGQITFIDGKNQIKILSVNPKKSEFTFRIVGSLEFFGEQFDATNKDSYALIKAIRESSFGLLLRETSTYTILQCKIGYIAKSPSSLPIITTHITCHIPEASLAQLPDSPSGKKSFDSLELLLFSYQKVGTRYGNFKRKNWRPFTNPSAPLPPEITAEAPQWAQATLPTEPSKEEVSRYLDLILYQLPNNLIGEELRLAKKKYAILSGEQIDALMERIPLLEPADALTKEHLNNSLTESSLPEFLTALKRDPSLAKIALKKGWSQEAAPILAQTLTRRVPFHPRDLEQIFQILASEPDSSSYPDLAWHFIHASSHHSQLEKQLLLLPHFPIEQSVQEAWLLHRATLLSSLPSLAAKYGNKEALRVLLATNSYKPIPELKSLLPNHPQAASTIWTSEKFSQLTYNSQSQNYH